MIEFFLSKFWAVICAIALISAVTSSVMDLTQASSARSAESGLVELAEELNDFCKGEGVSRMTLSSSAYLDDDGDILVIRPGSIWVQGEGHSMVRELSQSMKVFNNEGTQLSNSSSLSIAYGEKIQLFRSVENGTGSFSLYPANVSTSFFTDSTNFSHSALSL